MQPVYFASRIKIKYKDELEQILFFNKLQKEYLTDIAKSIESYGLPRIVQDKSYIKIELENLKDVQSIFAIDGEGDNSNLLGLILYYRLNVEEIVVLHIAVVDECSAIGEFSQEFVTLRLINKLRENANKIKGVEKIRISYSGDFKKFTIIKIKKTIEG